MTACKTYIRQKLYKPEAGQSFSNLDPVMALRAINWELIEEQLDTMVKHAAALKYGNGGELATNRRENQEIGLLCLHLLQASLVYINTLMIQQVLDDAPMA